MRSAALPAPPWAESRDLPTLPAVRLAPQEAEQAVARTPRVALQAPQQAEQAVARTLPVVRSHPEDREALHPARASSAPPSPQLAGS